jgi:hypothetical protein
MALQCVGWGRRTMGFLRAAHMLTALPALRRAGAMAALPPAAAAGPGGRGLLLWGARPAARRPKSGGARCWAVRCRWPLLRVAEGLDARGQRGSCMVVGQPARSAWPAYHVQLQASRAWGGASSARERLVCSIDAVSHLGCWARRSPGHRGAVPARLARALQHATVWLDWHLRASAGACMAPCCADA